MSPQIIRVFPLFDTCLRGKGKVRFVCLNPFLSDLLELYETTPSSTTQACILQASSIGDPYYVFLLLPHSHGLTEELYAQMLHNFLEELCAITKLIHPEAQDIIGIGTETENKADIDHFEEMVYFNARSWSEEQQERAQRLRANWEFSANIRTDTAFEWRYLKLSSIQTYGQATRPTATMKGRDRNTSCPCGSGKKYKKCCGR